MSQFTSSKMVALASATSLLAISAPALAQEQDTASGNDIIIVTAQKKSQNLQDVPIAITAFDEEGLEAARITGVQNIDKLVPGVLTTPNPADANGVRINIRGIGTFDPQIGQDSRVAIYLDGVYLGKSQGLAFDSPDLVRAEVVKGPQGTLYGRNAVAGAVNLILAKPSTDKFSGKMAAEYGRYNHRKFSGAINAPLGDQVAVRLSASYQEQDGWVDNLGSGADFGGGERFSFRAAFGFELSDDVRLDMAADHSSAKTEPLFYQAVPGFRAPGQPFAAAITPRTGRQNTVTTPFTNERGDLKTTGFTGSLEWDFSDDHRFKFIASHRKAESSSFVALLPEANPFILNGIVNTAPPGGLSLNGLFSTAIGSAGFFGGGPFRPDIQTAFAPSAAPGPQTGLFLSPPGAANQLHDHEQYSFEGTFTGDFNDGALEYTLGAFYFNEDTGNDPNQNRNPDDLSSLLLTLATAQSAGTFLAVLGGAQIPGLTPQIAAQSFTAAFGNVRSSTAGPLRIQTEALALYGELTWNVTDALSITGGLRYSDESKDGQGQPVVPFFFDNISLTNNVIDPNIGAIDFDVLDPSLVVEFEPSDDVLLYASYKQSFRSGGFNQSAIAPNAAGLTYGSDFIFGRESITSYEAGFKLDLMDNRLRINGAGFYYDFKDQQTTAATNPLIATERVVVNTDEKIWGLELDALFSLTDSLSINASYSWIDGNAGDVPDLINGGVDIRDELQGTPKHSFVIGASFNTDISDTVSFFANANYSYKDDVLAIPADELRLSTRNLVSARLGFEFETSGGSTATLTFWGENLLNDKYQIDSLPFDTFAYRTQVFGQPASYGVTAGIKF